MRWGDGLVAGSPYGRRWTAPSSTVCPAPSAALPPGPPRSVALPFGLELRRDVRIWKWGHTTTPAKSRRPQWRHEGKWQGWHEPSACRPTGVGGPQELGCSLADHPPSPPRTLDPTSDLLLPVALLCWYPFGEEEWGGIGPVLYLYLHLHLLHTSVSSHLSCVQAIPFPSPYLSLLCVFLDLSVACPVRSRAQCWYTNTDIGMTRRCGLTFGTCITQSCTSRWSRISSRRRRPDNSIVLDPWCDPPASFPPPSTLSTPRHWLIGLLVRFGHLCLWIPLLLEGLSLMSRLSSAVYLDACTNYGRAIFRNFFDGFVLTSPSPLCSGGEGGGGWELGGFTPQHFD